MTQAEPRAIYQRGPWARELHDGRCVDESLFARIVAERYVLALVFASLRLCVSSDLLFMVCSMH